VTGCGVVDDGCFGAKIRHQLAAIVEALLENGFREDEIRGVMGENALRVLAATLP